MARVITILDHDDMGALSALMAAQRTVRPDAHPDVLAADVLADYLALWRAVGEHNAKERAGGGTNPAPTLSTVPIHHNPDGLGEPVIMPDGRHSTMEREAANLAFLATSAGRPAESPLARSRKDG